MIGVNLTVPDTILSVSFNCVLFVCTKMGYNTLRMKMPVLELQFVLFFKDIIPEHQYHQFHLGLHQELFWSIDRFKSHHVFNTASLKTCVAINYVQEYLA